LQSNQVAPGTPLLVWTFKGLREGAIKRLALDFEKEKNKLISLSNLTIFILIAIMTQQRCMNLKVTFKSLSDNG
jgi:hypothetical protein